MPRHGVQIDEEVMAFSCNPRALRLGAVLSVLLVGACLLCGALARSAFAADAEAGLRIATFQADAKQKVDGDDLIHLLRDPDIAFKPRCDETQTKNKD